MIFHEDGAFVFRSLRDEDIPHLMAILPPVRLPNGEVGPKPTSHFYIYSTIVVEYLNKAVGMTQYCLTPDNIIHSYALCVAPEMRGRGLGTKLLTIKEKIAIEAGAKHHYYVIDKENNEKLVKILLGIGMHLCVTYPDIQLYAKGLVSNA